MSGRLLVFSPNWLGDAVMALPALDAVRHGTPGATIDVAARPSVAPMFSLVAGVERVLTLTGGAADVNALRQGRYDTAMLFPNSFNAARLAWRAGIPERWGYRGDARSWLLTRAISPPLRVHQVDYYRELVEACGYQSTSGVPTLVVSDATRAGGGELLQSAGWDGTTRLVAMAPGAAFGTAKRWPAESFAGVADRFAAGGVRVVLLGSAADRPAADSLIAAMRSAGAPIDLVGRTNLPQLAGVLLHCRALVTNDSGAMHLAAALGVHVTAMFGPTRETETTPRGAGQHVCLTNAVWCRPCMLRECPLTQRCMTGISVEAVHAATRSFL